MIKKLIHKIFHTECEWEYRYEAGEEEHGKNPAKRYCKICNRNQHSFYHKFGDIRIEWRDLNRELDQLVNKL